MSYVDSQSVFKARCDEIKISPATFTALKTKGWDTFGSFAFSVSTNPGQITDDDFDNKVAIPGFGGSECSRSSVVAQIVV